MKISEINPWWKTSAIDNEFLQLPKRGLFDELIPYIGERQIIAINGLRRMGKTVLMHHLIDFLLKKQKPESILYYNFDLLDDKLENILSAYQDMVGIDFKKEKIFVFLDEIQKHENWENELKVLYDNFKNMKFIITGSSSLFIEKKSKESLGGRVFSFALNPLTFKEYIRLAKTGIGEKPALYEKEIKTALRHYMRIGGFPELMNTTDETKINRYIKELVIDRIIYIDIPKAFEIDEPELLARILSII
ncbi:MAG: AAA family ATPase, partial [Candidatus Diapherotrites archaeon]